MAKTTLGLDLLPLLDRLRDVLVEEPNVVRQQSLIELLAVSHAMRFGDDAEAVIAGIQKHIGQLIRQRPGFLTGGGKSQI